MDGGNHRRGRDWPGLVGRRDLQLGPRGRLGNPGLSSGRAYCGLSHAGSHAPPSVILHCGSHMSQRPTIIARVLKSIRRKFGVSHRVLDVLVAEPSL